MKAYPLELNKYESINKWQLFLLLGCYYILYSFLWQELLFTDNVYYNTFAEQVSIERIERYVSMKRKVQWIAYLLMPLIVLIKTSLVAICLNVGTLFSGYKVRFGQLLRVTLMAEGIFVLSSIIRVVWLYFYIQPTTIMEIKSFYPLSALNLLEGQTEAYFIYPLQTLNVFEIGYWFVLAYGLSRVLAEKYSKAFGLVMASYGIGLLLWGLFITFLSVNFS